MKAGVNISGVFDTAPWRTKAHNAPGMLLGGKALWLGLKYRHELTRAGVEILEGITPHQIRGTQKVTGFCYCTRTGKLREIACNAIGFGYGVKSETRLAQLAGAALEYNDLQASWQIADDGAGRIAPNFYAAGDGSVIAGADAAEISGRLVALSILEDQGHSIGSLERATLKWKQRRFRNARIDGV